MPTRGQKQPFTLAIISEMDVFLEITQAFKIRMMTFGTSELLNYLIVIRLLILNHMGLPEIFGLHYHFSNLSLAS